MLNIPSPTSQSTPLRKTMLIFYIFSKQGFWEKMHDTEKSETESGEYLEPYLEEAPCNFSRCLQQILRLFKS